MIEVKLDGLTLKVDGSGNHEHFDVERAILLEVDGTEMDVTNLIDSVAFSVGAKQSNPQLNQYRVQKTNNDNMFWKRLGVKAAENYTENEYDQDAAYERLKDK